MGGSVTDVVALAGAAQFLGPGFQNTRKFS